MPPMMSNPSFRSTVHQVRADDLVAGDLARAAHLRDVLREAYNSVARLSFDCTEWPTDGYDQRETLRTLRDLMPPAEISSGTQQEWHDRALELLAAGELS
jgi:hypothetical protein